MEQFHTCVFFLYFPFASSCVVFSLELYGHIAFISITPREGLLKNYSPPRVRLKIISFLEPNPGLKFWLDLYQ